MKLAYDFYKSLILVNKNLTKEIFLEKTGAKSGYSWDMFCRMYDNITSELIDMEREYEKYYSFEYKTFECFLFRKLNLKYEDLVLLMKEKQENPDCIIYRKEDGSYGDHGIDTFTFSDALYDRITNIIMLK